MSGLVGEISGAQGLSGTLNNGVTIIYRGQEAAIDSMSINSDGELIVTLTSGTSVTLGVVRGAPGTPGTPGDRGLQGYTVESVYLKSGTGAPGTTDTYGISINDDGNTEVGTFTVYNGSNGTNGLDGDGSGDMLKSVYDPNDDGVVKDSDKLGGELPTYYAAATSIPTKTSDLTNDSGFIIASDVTVPTKTSDLTNDSGYITDASVTARKTGSGAPTTATEGRVGDLYSCTGDAKMYRCTAADGGVYTWEEIGSSTNVPTKTSDLTNDSGFITSYVETDPTVPEWAKAENKPTYTATEVGAEASGAILTHNSSLYAHLTQVNVLPPSGTALADNTVYFAYNSAAYITSSYLFVPPTVSINRPAWAHGVFYTTTPSIAIAAATGDTASYLGDAPTFEANSWYEFDVAFGVWIFKKIGGGSVA